MMRWRRPGLGLQVFLGIVVGILIALLWPSVGVALKPLGDIFLRLIRSAVAPMVFVMLSQGLLAGGAAKRLGKVTAVALVYFEIVSFLALLFGMGAAMLLKVGSGIPALPSNSLALKGAEDAAKQAAHGQSAIDFILNIVPDNFIGAFARGELLQVTVLAVIVGLSLRRLPAPQQQSAERALTLVSRVLFQFINLVMKLSPLGALGAIAFVVGSNGLHVLLSLAYMVAMLYLSSLAFILIVFGGISIIFRFNLLKLIRFVGDELIIVFGTATSESVLARLLEKLPNYGISKGTVGLVVPTSYAFNIDGATLFMSFAFVFLANAYHVNLSAAQLFGTLMIMAVTTKGIASVTGGAFVALSATVASSGLVPVESLALIFGVYRFMSMIAAVVNITGHAVATVVIAKICGELEAPSAVPGEDPAALRAETLSGARRP